MAWMSNKPKSILIVFCWCKRIQAKRTSKRDCSKEEEVRDLGLRGRPGIGIKNEMEIRRIIKKSKSQKRIKRKEDASGSIISVEKGEVDGAERHY